MSSRRLEILRAIVDEYVSTQEPVGSKSIADHHGLGISPATIRNEMAVLEEEGLITQPHTSAGRIPTDLGYRVFVDKLVVFNIDHNEFVLETLVEINPYSNFALEGFYQSGPQLCTQCEPEGFRRITYFIDRPDNMAIFKTRMIADKKRYPYLLSNGNKIAEGDLGNDRHFVEWQDPFKKPCYLFAMVADLIRLPRTSSRKSE